jgi:hypothetical protein
MHNEENLAEILFSFLFFLISRVTSFNDTLDTFAPCDISPLLFSLADSFFSLFFDVLDNFVRCDDITSFLFLSLAGSIFLFLFLISRAIFFNDVRDKFSKGDIS